MNDSLLTMIAITAEAGISIALIYLFFKQLKYRNRIIVILGAITPLIVLYSSVIIMYLLNSEDGYNKFIFFSAWSMSLFAFISIIIIGAMISLIKKPTNIYLRYVMGLFSAPIFIVLQNYVYWPLVHGI